jgi:ketosteroid isomerase-like protein
MDCNRKRLIILNARTSTRVRVSALMPISRTGRIVLSLACAAACLAPAPLAAHDPDEIALGSLVDAELAFAQLGLERGVRAAFLAHFADDGVVFEPAPVRLRETWSARPAPADPRALKLEWKPAQAGMSRSRDMGYTTGPFVATNTARPGAVRQGVFFSVWQRNAAGMWQVVLDAGIATPAAVDFATLGAAPRPHFRGSAKAAAERRRLLDREAAIGKNDGATPNGYAQLLDASVRLHRDGMPPLASRGAAAPEIARRMSRVSWTPIDAKVSAAADMAVTHGRYRETDRDGHAHDGYYAHLWLRDAAGAWRIAYDVALAATPP